MLVGEEPSNQDLAKVAKVWARHFRRKDLHERLKRRYKIHSAVLGNGDDFETITKPKTAFLTIVL